MEATADVVVPNSKQVSQEICQYRNPNENHDNGVNIETIKRSDKDLNSSKGKNLDNGFAFGTFDKPSAYKKGEANGVVSNTSNSMNDCVNKKNKAVKKFGSFNGGKKATIAVSDVDGRAFDILLK